KCPPAGRVARSTCGRDTPSPALRSSSWTAGWTGRYTTAAAFVAASHLLWGHDSDPVRTWQDRIGIMSHRRRQTGRRTCMAAPATLQFLGASGTVTGSKYLVRHRGQQVLLDCGLFQGLKELRLRNWLEPAFVPREIAAVVISHAHLDHTGYLPLLVKRGFRGKVHSTSATADLMEILLPDSAKLQEEDAERANREHY